MFCIILLPLTSNSINDQSDGCSYSILATASLKYDNRCNKNRFAFKDWRHDLTKTKTNTKTKTDTKTKTKTTATKCDIRCPITAPVSRIRVVGGSALPLQQISIVSTREWAHGASPAFQYYSNSFHCTGVDSLRILHYSSLRRPILDIGAQHSWYIYMLYIHICCRIILRMCVCVSLNTNNSY